MKNKNETIREIIAELSQEEALDRAQILNYSNRFSSACKREKDATRSRIYRLNKKSSVTRSVTDSVTRSVTDSVTNSVTQTKEERSEKENFSPTPPLREKAKKEENAHPSGVRAARAHAHEDVPDLATVLALAPETGVSDEYARWWHSEMTARDWTSPNGSRITLANWRSVMRAWYLRRNDTEVDAAKRMAIRLILPRPTKKSTYPLAAWELCRERCANCGKKGCKVGIPTPPPSENPPRPPEECHKFVRIGKEVR